jgi:hypothetical protein
MAWLEKRREHFRIVFRFREERLSVNLKATDRKDAKACLARLEENLRLVERGRLAVPDGADFGLFLLSDGKLDKPVQLVRSVTLAELFADYQTNFTAGAKEVVTRKMENIHMKHVSRVLGGNTPVAVRGLCSPRRQLHRRREPSVCR